MKNRLKEVERMLEKKEKKERRRNIVIKRVEMKEKGKREAVEKFIRAVGVEVEVKELRRIGGDRENGEKMV